MNNTPLFYPANFSPEALRKDLSAILVPGKIEDQALSRWVERLGILFDTYCQVYPYGLWAPGLALLPEMRNLTDLLLPMDVISPAVRALCRKALRIESPGAIPSLHGPSSWLDIVSALPEALAVPNPARLLSMLLADERARAAFLFSLHLPSRHGGAFGRYPAQLATIRRWAASGLFPQSCLNCLDAACGSGEGTYELAVLLNETCHPGSFRVQGLSLDPFEIFAAAHGYFPHDRRRQERFRLNASPVMEGNGASVSFGTADLSTENPQPEYDLVLCNGLLGGPLLHREEMVARVVGFLAGSLRPGGYVLVADRFHGGWEKKLPKRALAELFRAHGVEPVPVGEGVGGMKKGGRRAAAGT